MSFFPYFNIDVIFTSTDIGIGLKTYIMSLVVGVTLGFGQTLHGSCRSVCSVEIRSQRSEYFTSVE